MQRSLEPFCNTRRVGHERKDVDMKDLVKEFRDFVNRGNLVELAIAFVLAAAFGAVVLAIVNGVLMPLIAAIFGEANFDEIVWTVGEGEILIGTAITALVNFLVIALVCFFIIKAYNRFKADAEEEGPSEIDLLTEIRDELRRRSS
jgi:large conductance mechanosensitive channel